MKEKLTQRLEDLKSELKTGQQMEADLENKLTQLRATLLRISGAIQVLEELLGNDAEASDTNIVQLDPTMPRTAGTEVTAQGRA